MAISVSVVINTLNRARLLADALRGLSEVDYADFEVIVVNGPSTDDTKNVLEKFRGKIKIGECPEANLSMSRNVGIAMSAGEVIAFVDDDAVPHPSWLARLTEHYRSVGVAGVGGFTIDNTGMTYQARKTLCDRFGDAYYPSDFFDERRLCFRGSPVFPSLLGTNSSFRAAALREIGGFDHTYAYLLDETDVCLRLIDRGYQIVYEPNALIYHQFAPSHIRGKNRVPRSLYPSAVSKSYFIHRFGGRLEELGAAQRLHAYQEQILVANKWLHDHGEITSGHWLALDQDVLSGIREGAKRAAVAEASGRLQQGDLELSTKAEAFLPAVRKSGLRIALVSRSFPPRNEAGIARWTMMMACGLSERGHKVHVITEADVGAVTRYENGFWTHEIVAEGGVRAERFGAMHRIPPGLSPWCLAVKDEVRRLRDFGLDVVSFPIWDVEGIGVARDDSLGVVMSLHTSYAMAKPFKPEWNERPLFEHFHVDRVIAAEVRMLQDVSVILANSKAIVQDLAGAHGIDFEGRTVLAPHGTFDVRVPARSKAAAAVSGPGIKVTYVGRFEPRKGFDLACAAAGRLLRELEGVSFAFVGDQRDENVDRLAREVGGEELLRDPRVEFLGKLPRTLLDETYRDSDVILMPSRYESFGLVAIEAFAAGTPVIALASGGLKEIVEDGVTGFLVAPGTDEVGAIVQAVRRLASDRELLASMRRSARQAFEERFTVARMVEAAEPAYYEAARRRKTFAT